MSAVDRSELPAVILAAYRYAGVPGAEGLAALFLAEVSAHDFTRPGQVDPGLPPPDACVRCGAPAVVHPPG